MDGKNGMLLNCHMCQFPNSGHKAIKKLIKRKGSLIIRINILYLFWDWFDGVVGNKFFMLWHYPQIKIELLLISIEIVVTFDIKIDLFKIKSKKFWCTENNDINLINKKLFCLDQE